jgi:hypothetical protein
MLPNTPNNPRCHPRLARVAKLLMLTLNVPASAHEPNAARKRTETCSARLK